MGNSYEAIAGTRPKLRRDVLFAKMPYGVLFHDSAAGFEIRSPTGYAFASLIVPHLNGTNRLADICGGLGERQRGLVTDLVAKLLEYGFARDVQDQLTDQPPFPDAVAEVFAEQIGYIDHFVDQADERFARFRAGRVAIAGSGPIADWCALSLIRNGAARVDMAPGPGGRYRLGIDDEVRLLREKGCEVTVGTLPANDEPYRWPDLARYDIVVVPAGAGAAGQILTLLAAGVPADRVLLPAATVADRILIGPMASHTGVGCWVCAVLRLERNDPGSGACLLWRAACLPVGAQPTAEVPEPLAAIAGNLLGYEVFRLITEVLPAETDGHVIDQNLDSMDVNTMRVLPDPWCPHCSPAGETDDPIAVPAHRDLPEQAHGAGPEQNVVLDQQEDPTAAAQAQWDRLTTMLVHRGYGVFTAFDDDELVQSPLKVSRITLVPRHGCVRTVYAFDCHQVLGARRTALYAAAARYVDHLIPPVRVVSEPAATGLALAIHPPPDEYQPPTSGWVAARSLITGQRKLVPLDMVRVAGGSGLAPLAGTGAGTGVGTSTVEAQSQALLAALCDEAVGRAIRGVRVPTRVPLPDAGGDPRLSFLLRSAANHGLDLEVLDLGEAPMSSVSVVLARCRETDENPGVHAIAAGLTRPAAILDALMQLLGRLQIGRDRAASESAVMVDTGGPVLEGFDAALLSGVTDTDSAEPPAASYQGILATLHRAGRDVLALTTTPADLTAAGLVTVRVLLADRG